MKVNSDIIIWFFVAGLVISVMTGAYLQRRPEVKRFGVVGAVVYNDDKPSALIDNTIIYEGNTIHGVEILKIHTDKVEFTKDQKVWTQSVKQKPNPAWPKIRKP